MAVNRMNKYKLLVTMFTAALLTANSSIVLADTSSKTMGKCRYNKAWFGTKMVTKKMTKWDCDRKKEGTFKQN